MTQDKITEEEERKVKETDMFGRSERLSKSLQEILKEHGKGSVGA